MTQEQLLPCPNEDCNNGWDASTGGLCETCDGRTVVGRTPPTHPPAEADVERVARQVAAFCEKLPETSGIKGPLFSQRQSLARHILAALPADTQAKDADDERIVPYGIHLRSAVQALIGYTSLPVGVTITPSWLERLKNHYIPNVEKALVQAQPRHADTQALANALEEAKRLRGYARLLRGEYSLKLALLDLNDSEGAMRASEDLRQLISDIDVALATAERGQGGSL